MDVSDQFVSNVFDPSFTGSGKHAAVEAVRRQCDARTTTEPDNKDPEGNKHIVFGQNP